MIFGRRAHTAYFRNRWCVAQLPCSEILFLKCWHSIDTPARSAAAFVSGSRELYRRTTGYGICMGHPRACDQLLKSGAISGKHGPLDISSTLSHSDASMTCKEGGGAADGLRPTLASAACCLTKASVGSEVLQIGRSGCQKSEIDPQAGP